MTAEAIIVGGGLVGALTALLLGQQGRRVALVERSRPNREVGELGVDLRNVAISPASAALLDQAGVWDASRSAAYTEMRVWEERGTGEVAFTAASVGREELGWICENSRLLEALWAALDAIRNVSVHVGDEIQDVAVGPAEARLALPGETLVGRLLIGADGGRSLVRSALNVGLADTPTGHCALATVVRIGNGHAGIAWQRFLLEGPLAVLPSSDPHLASVVWSQSPEAAGRRRDMDAQAFCAELEASLEHRLGRVEVVDRRVVFPISQLLVENFNPVPRALLIGDAARVIHPLAGLGANVGCEDVRALVKTAQGVPVDGDLGAQGTWSGFARRRRARAQFMLGLMTVFRRTYAAKSPLSHLLRNTGVSLFDRSGWVKQQFIREALGVGQAAGPLTRSW